VFLISNLSEETPREKRTIKFVIKLERFNSTVEK